MSNNCEFCSSSFSNKKSLLYHQKNAKYCLQNRGVSTIYKCQLCNKELSEKRQLEKHKEKCGLSQKTENQNKIIQQLTQQLEVLKQMSEKSERLFREQLSQKDQQITELQNRLENIAIQGVKKHTSTSITNNQTINNLIPITDDHLKEQSQFLTIDHIKQGALGYANFACDYALKDRITCVDLSRRKIKYKNHDGQVITDPEMTILSKKLFSSIQEKNTQLTRQYKQELRDMVLEKFRESGDVMTDEETKELDTAIEEINKCMENASNLDYQVGKIVEGEKPNIYHDFIKEVCNKIVN